MAELLLMVLLQAGLLILILTSPKSLETEHPLVSGVGNSFKLLLAVSSLALMLLVLSYAASPTS